MAAGSKLADVAQLAEQLTCNQQVNGSSPFIGFFKKDSIFYCILHIIYGRVPEWPKGADCKSVSYAFEGSNPSPPIVLSAGKRHGSAKPRHYIAG